MPTDPPPVLAYPLTGRSSDLKLWRAATHLKEFQELAGDWANETLQTVSEEPDPPGPDYYAIWVEPARVNHSLAALIAGDCLQCLRTALDHLAFELAATHTVPMTDDVEQDSEFPIFGDRDGRGDGRFRQLRVRGTLKGQPAPGSGLAKIRGMHKRARAVIESLQPYKRGNDYVNDPLWKLHTLNRVDKHRRFHTTGAATLGNTFNPRDAQNVAALGTRDGSPAVLESIGLPFPPEGRAKVARWPMIPIDPSQKMRMNMRPVVDIIFDEDTPIVGGQSVYATLIELHNHVVARVFTPLASYL
jgi:hypothetical protein